MRATNAVRPAESEKERAIAAYTWYDTRDCADRAGVSTDTIRKDIAGGRLKARNIGTSKRPEYRVRPDWLEAYLARQIVNPDAA